MIVNVVSFLGTGISLIFYSRETSNPNFLFIVGIILCLYAIINPILLTIIPRYREKLDPFDLNLKRVLLPTLIITLFMSVLNWHENPHFELVFILLFGFSIVAVIKMFFDFHKSKKSKTKTDQSKRVLLYKIFVRLGLLFVSIGLFFVFYGVYEPEITKKLIEMNEWVYNPLISFAAAIVCVFPILILNPKK